MYETVIESFRLSPQQRHLCALRPLDQTVPYRTHIQARLDGSLEIPRLHQALAQVVARHEILHTNVVLVPGFSIPRQVIASSPLLSFTAHDLRAIADEARDEALRAQVEQHRQQSLNLDTGPVVLVTLLVCSANEHYLLLDLPALNGDVTTCQLLLQEVGRRYENDQWDEEALEEPFQYADLAEWQHELLTSTETTAGRAYWREVEQNTQAEVMLPYAQQPACEVAFEPETLRITLDGTVLESLDTLAGHWEVSRSSLALLCWALVLARLTEQPAVLIGTGFEGRRYTELTETLGLLATYLPLTYRLSANASCREGARHVEEQLLEARQWQEYFSWEHWREEREQAQEPYTAFGFDYTVLPSPWQAGSLRFQIQVQEQWLERFTVRLACCDQAQALQVMLCYDQRIYTPVEMQRLLAQWQATLLQLIQAPQSIQADIVSLSAEEWKLLRAWNATQVDYPLDQTLPQLFTEQVARTPDAIALISQNAQIRYQELENRANQVAWYLRHQGVGPEVCVGICLGRSIDMVVGLLGILKAGGVYVPLDPDYPTERLALLIREAGLRLVLTQQALLERIPTASISTLCLDRDSELLALESTTPPDSGACSENLAYVLYTSGSTGLPKGVMVPHRGLVNYLSWSTETYEVALGTGTLLHSSLTFDLTITGLFPPLLAGRSVTLLQEDHAVEQLGQALLSSTQLSLLKLTPTHLDVLRQTLPAEAIAGRTRALIIGGEALSADQLRFWRTHAPDTRLINEYGPTETVVGCSFYEVPASWTAENELIPIGCPIANTHLYVLDSFLHPVPLGGAGELYIGGAGLSRGYLNRPDLTAARFVPDPFSSLPGARLYQTGDRVRILSNGTLLFLGRLDQQVKIHGFRIELGEIEATLRQHPAVREAVVLARTDTPHEPRLVAYVVAQPAHTLTIADLRQWLQTSLPDYMLPSSFVPLEHLPVTPNGKLDRQALPPPDSARLEQGTPYIAPRTLEEEVLAGVWSQVLGITRIGIDDHYFALGGDSIRSIQVVSQAQERGLHLSVDQVFRFPTIRTLAQALLTEQPGEEVAEVGERKPFDLLSEAEHLLFPAEVEDAYPLTMLQGGMLFHNEYSPGAGVYHDIFSYHVKLLVDIPALKQAAQALVARHPVLRTAFDLSSYPEPLQLVYRTGPEILTVENVQQETEEQQERLIRAWIAAEQERGFDWTRPPLLRIHIHLRAENRAQFTLSFHHAIIDGWSDATLLTELFMHYFALLHAQPFSLTTPVARFRDFVALERAAVASSACQNYWDRTLEGSNFTALARWPHATDPQETGVIVQPVPLSEAVSQGLKELALATAVPVKNVLLAAHLRVLSLLSGQEDVTTCVVSGGRPEGQDGERVLGLFINSIPFRLHLPGGTWRQLVTETFEKEREALSFRRYPMAELKRRHGGLRLSETLFYFTHYHIFRGLQKLGDLEVLELIPHEVSSFPLVANFWIDPFNTSVNLSLTCDKTQFSTQQVQALAGYYAATLTAMATASQKRYEMDDLLLDEERTHLLHTWNATTVASPQQCIHELIAAQTRRMPEAPAIIYKKRQLSYQELDEQTNQVAHYLRKQGVGPEVRVGIYMERSLELVVGLLGILKTGGAYVPLDPNYPSERLDFLIQDAGMPIILTQRYLLENIRDPRVLTICLDRDNEQIAQESVDELVSGANNENTAYVIYTSGSTGQPKGVMVTHRNVTNFFQGMDIRIGDDIPGTWLAVTSISFDISVLELFWTLARGFKVVLQEEQNIIEQVSRQTSNVIGEKQIDFSLFYFASDEGERVEDKYRLLLEGAKFADEHGFSAVWTPERHFHTFGGLYPNPSVTGAALAAVTNNIQIRAGSVVSPLHNPIRIAEEWSVVDNLSHGRVGLSFASGWHAQDFVLAPENYANRKEVLVRSIETIQRLWRNEAITCVDGNGAHAEVRIHPRPIQEELPIWLTAAGNPATFQMAGEMGLHLLTHLLGQSLEDLAEKIALYRAAWRSDPHRTGAGHVTLMLHTFVGEKTEDVREKVRKPFCDYLRNSLDLVKDLAASLGYTGDPRTFAEDDIEVLLSHAFDRYFETSGLLGEADKCLALVEKLKGIGVDEIACLIDFGVDCDAVLSSLHYLNEVKERCNSSNEADDADYSIAEQIARHHVSHLQCTPSLGRILATDEQTLAALGGLRTLLLGGEALSPALANQFLATLPTKIYNMYGPTETTIWSTVYPIEDAQESMPIGSPIFNTQVYILDAHLQPVPIGVTGEICIGGVGVVRGYLNRPELTAERFIPDRFSTMPGARLYKTGDRGRYLPDGNIEFLGRNDYQVKIRGHRIELGEIEAVLEAHPQVRECAVIAYAPQAEAEEKHLAAYIVPNPETSIAVDEIRSFLRKKLPSYMLPTDFVLLDFLPLTPNKKVDKKALPLPDASQLEANVHYKAPRTAIEEILAGIWGEILGIEKVGIDDTFFDLGGYSLQATQFIARLRPLFQINLPLRSFFEAPTVADLSAQIEIALQLKDETSDVALLPVSHEGYLPLSFAQSGIWFLDQLAPHTSSYNEPAAVKLQGKLDRDVLEQSLNTIIQRHEVLRCSFTTFNGQPVHTIEAEIKLPLIFNDLSDLSPDIRGDEVLRRATQEIQKPFDLATAPLLRMALFRLDEDEHILLLITHHIISDGWSMGIFVKELATLYTAFLQGAPSPLLALPIQYSDFAVWQRQWLQGDVFEQHLDYWKTQLQAPLPALQLPLDHPRPAVQSFRGATHFFQLSPHLSAGIKALGRQEGATLFMVLLAAFNVLLHYHSGQDDLVVGTDVANRNRVETEDLIGLFVNQLVLRTNLAGNPSFHEVLRHIREVTLGAFAHQDFPFDRLVEALNPTRDLSRTPLFQVKFVLQNAPIPLDALSNMVVQPVEVERGTSKFDLLLNLSENTQNLFGWLEYSTDIFEADRIKLFIRQFEAILDSIVLDKEVQLDTLKSVLSAIEQEEQQIREQQLQQASLQKLGAARRKKNRPATQKEKIL
jgi:natural product biosynthesis luciferase-like monooxygenase protein/amino acid adenylation domain-containing protein